MNTPIVVVFPRGQLSSKDKERFTKHGVLTVEADDPNKVCQLHLTQPLIATNINGDAIIKAALQAMASQEPEDRIGNITSAGRVKSKFVELLAKSIVEQK